MKHKRKLVAVLLFCGGMVLFFSLAISSTYARDDEGTDSGKQAPGHEKRATRQSDQNGKRQRGRAEPGRNGSEDRSESDQDFYRVIVENNLFRPLGWKKPSRKPEYTLIGTWVESQGEIAKALVMERKSNQIYYASTGDKVGDATVEKIETNRVSLNISGKVINLKADSIQFLSGSSGKPPKDKSSEASPQRARVESRDRKQDSQDPPSRENVREKFINASPEERRRLIQEFRQRGGERRGGRGGRRQRR